MKKVLSILLVIALSAVLLSGCTPKQSGDVNTTPTPQVDQAKKIDPQYSDEVDENGIWKDVITFNVFNTDDYQTRWSDGAKAWMLDNFHIKVGYIIPAITGFTDTFDVCTGHMMEDPSNREEYKSKLVSLFLSEKTRPDYLPSIYASCVGTDGAWFAIADYLVDLNPYLAEGGALYDTYVNWLWAEDKDYWLSMKEYLEDENGHLYVIPRREKMPIQTFLEFSTTALSTLGISWEDKPTDWDDFVEYLRKYMALQSVGSEGQFYKTAFRTTLESGADLLQFVASTYGIDFNADYSWTTKNGEPLWSYYWDEYLEILKDINMLAAEELVLTNAEEETCIANYTLDKSDATYKASIAGQEQAAAYSGAAAYMRDDKIASIASDPRSSNKWKTSDTWISHAGYDYSMIGGSSFDSDYLAIGNALGDVFTSRIIDFWNYSLSDEGFLRYSFGKEGTPFADTIEEAGNYIFDENGKVLFTNHANRFSFTKVENHHWWDSRDANWWAEHVDEHYAAYIENYNASGFSNAAAGDGDTIAALCGITDTKVWENDTGFRAGTYFVADVTGYPMEKTAYWPDESMSTSRPSIQKVESIAEANNSICYKGFFDSTKTVLGRDSSEMDKKIASLSSIAKQFTVEFLGGKQTEAGWTNYIKNLQEAGYDEVYAYYELALKGCVTTTKEGVKSQTDVNASRS